MTSLLNGAKSPNPAAIDAAPPLEIHAEPEARGVRIRLRGEVDLATAGGIRCKINECVAAGCRRIVLDLRGVTFLGSTGVHLILETDATACAAGWELLLIEGPPTVQRVFELAGVRERLPFAEGSRMDYAGRRFAARPSIRRVLKGHGRGE